MSGQRQWKFLFISAPFGGIEVFCKNMKRVIDSHHEIDATWIWIEHQPDEMLCRIPPLSLNWTLKGGYAAWSRVHALERSGKIFDAVFFNHIIPARFLSSFRKRVPAVFSLDVTPEVLAPYNAQYRGREMRSTGFIASLKHRALKAVYQDASYLLAWSDLVRQSLIEDYDVRPARVEVIPPGIDLERWTPSPGKKPAERNHGSIKILFVGGEFQRKGGDLLLRIAQKEEFRACEFHFVTKSFHGECPGNVFVHADMQPNSGPLIGLYEQADIFALPTRADFSPQAVCEAFGFNLPVVTTMVGGLAEIVQENVNGFLTPPDDEDAFAKKLLLLVQSEAKRREFGNRGRRLVEDTYNIKTNAEKVIRYLKKAAEKNS